MYKSMIFLLLFSSGFAFSSGNQYNDEKNQYQEHSEAQGKRRRGRKPPKRALLACEDKESGTSCSFNSEKRGEVTGTCFSPSDDKPLACRPVRRNKR